MRTSESTVEIVEAPVKRLQDALSAVLGEKFEAEIRALVDGTTWYFPDLSMEEVFTLWITNHLAHSQDSQWVFQPLRVGERKFLCEQLGIQRADIVGKTPQELAELVLLASGFPPAHVSGNRVTVDSWHHLVELVKNDEDERAAVLARQRAERLLRKLLYFYCSTGHSPEFVAMLQNPGTLRLPKRLEDELTNTAPNPETRITALLLVDGWADLGFLALSLRKLSDRLVQAGARHVSGAPLKLLGAQEHDAFSKLGTALQPYTHDRPSKFESMQQELRDALLEVTGAVTAIVNRGILPDEVLVVEAGVAFAGPIFRCLKDSGTTRYYRTQQTPPIGKRILVVPSTDCDYARCEWVEAPW